MIQRQLLRMLLLLLLQLLAIQNDWDFLCESLFGVCIWDFLQPDSFAHCTRGVFIFICLHNLNPKFNALASRIKNYMGNIELHVRLQCAIRVHALAQLCTITDFGRDVVLQYCTVRIVAALFLYVAVYWFAIVLLLR